jgi:hypothetical protein
VLIILPPYRIDRSVGNCIVDEASEAEEEEPTRGSGSTPGDAVCHGEPGFP